MPTHTFPVDTFSVEGDPETVRETSRAYGRFATTASKAATDLRGLDSSTWVGTEGDLFRTKAAQIPPHLDTAHTAFAQVAGALGSFAQALADARRQMNGVRADAEQTFGLLAGARADLAQPTAALSMDEEHTRSLDGRVRRLQGAWDDQLTAAAGIRARLREAARQTGVAIRAASRTSPTASPDSLPDHLEQHSVQKARTAVLALQLLTMSEDARGAVTQLARTAGNAFLALRETLRLSRLRRSLTTASDFLDSRRLPRHIRRQMMRARNRQIANAIVGTRRAAQDTVHGLRTNRPLVNLAGRVPPGAMSAARAAGKALGPAGVVLSTVDLGYDVRNGDWGGVGSNAAAITGSVILMAAGGPVTLTAGAVLVAGSLIYENREHLAKAAKWTGNKIGDAAGTVGKGISDAAGTVGKGAKNAAGKVGRFFGLGD